MCEYLKINKFFSINKGKFLLILCNSIMDQRKRKNDFCKTLDLIITGKKRPNINTPTIETSTTEEFLERLTNIEKGIETLTNEFKNIQTDNRKIIDLLVEISKKNVDEDFITVSIF